MIASFDNDVPPARLALQFTDGRLMDVFLRGNMTVGRNQENDLVLDADGLETNHAKIIVDREWGHLIEDLHSNQGVFLNDVRVSKAKLLHGDELRIGSVQCIYLRTDIELTSPHRLDGLGSSKNKWDFDGVGYSPRQNVSPAVLAQHTETIKCLRHQVGILKDDFGQVLTLLMDIKQSLAKGHRAHQLNNGGASDVVASQSTVEHHINQGSSDHHEEIESSRAELEVLRQEQEHANQTLGEKYKALNALRLEKKELENVTYSLAQAKARLRDYEATAHILSDAFRAKRSEIHRLESATQLALQQLAATESQKAYAVSCYQQLIQQYQTLHASVEQLKADYEKYRYHPKEKVKFSFSSLKKSARV